MGTTGLTANAFGACSAAGSNDVARQAAREQLLVILTRALLMAVVFGSIVVVASEGMLKLLVRNQERPLLVMSLSSILTESCCDWL